MVREFDGEHGEIVVRFLRAELGSRNASLAMNRLAECTKTGERGTGWTCGEAKVGGMMMLC